MVYRSDSRLYIRSMSDLDPQALQATDNLNPSSPIFSPDGRWIAFYSSVELTLKKVAVSGGAAVTICPVGSSPLGMSWGSDGIVIGQGAAGVLRVSPNGGKPDVIVAARNGELLQGPQTLPGGKAVLFTASAGPSAELWDRAQVIVQTLETGERKTIFEGGSDARYLPTGHVVYALGGTLMAVAFDVRRLEVTDGAVPIVEGVRRSAAGVSGSAFFSVSDTGSLVYIPGPASTAASSGLDIALMDRKASVEPLKLPSGAYGYPRVSPNGSQIAFGTDDGREAVVSVYRLAGTSAMRRLTFGGKNRFPIWSMDGQRIAFQSDREGDLAVWWQRADGTGSAERLTRPAQGASHTPESWSPRDDLFVFNEAKGSTISLWMLSIQDKKAAPFAGVQSTGGSHTAAMFSPDGRWVAYTSNETGSGGDNNVYVQPFPATGTKYQISKAGENGHHPLWSPDGKELFYVPQVGRFVAVTVTTQPSFAVTNPVSVPRAFPTANPVTPRTFDITPGGKFVGVVTAGQAQAGAPQSAQVQVVLNWFEELKARAPAGK